MSVMMLLPGASVAAQDGARLPANIFVGSEGENYLRTLQSLGAVRSYPWSLRSFSPRDLANLTPVTDSHPWGGHGFVTKHERRWKGARLEVAPASGDVWYNTRFPFGLNDGAVWSGRGLTVALQGGASAQWGPVSATLAPSAFWAENRDFPLMTPLFAANSPFADPMVPQTADHPQRFGDKSYARLDPGQSTVRVDAYGVALGVSTANAWWGPMSELPYVLGNNAPGFVHAFVGSSQPFDVWIGRAQVRILYGRLDQSAYSPVDTGNGRRFASGFVGVLQPRLFPGLELGMARFFHTPWPDTVGANYFTHLFENFIKARIRKVLVPTNDNNQSADNQLASVFARWVMPRSGFELYTEFGREDHNWDERDLMVEPDHTSGLGFGLARSWRAGDEIRSLRFESLNYQSNTIQRHRAQGGAYYHGFTPQGHTHRGQLLAAGVAAGNGAAAVARFDRIGPRGAIGVSWMRMVTLDPQNSLRMPNAQHVVQLHRTKLESRGAMRGALGLVLDLNHQLTGTDAISARAEWSITRF